jgi:hypothetical protein
MSVSSSCTLPAKFVPLSIKSPVSVNDVPLATPILGVTSVGDVANTSDPVPVSSVTAASRFADDGVPKNVAIPVPSDVIPVPPFATGSVPVTPAVKETFVIVLLHF